jgi:hypothetical protein
MAHPLDNNANAMNVEDESLVSAYIDGQLDPEQLQAVESALLSNPRLSEQLRTLAIVRDLVGGLSRDASVDVSNAVLERIRPSRRPWVRLRSTISRFDGRGQRIRTAALLGIAASTIIATTIALSLPMALRHHRSESRANSVPLTVAVNNLQRASKPDPTREKTGLGSLEKPSSSDPPKSAVSAPSSVSTSEIAATNASTEISSLDQSRDLESVRKLLDDPNLKRFFFVRGGRDGTARLQVASVVEQTTGSGFYKITIAQGIVIDPRHPEEATVFAVLVKPKELDNFVDKLRLALPDSVEETPVDPRIVTQLADIGQVQAYPAWPGVTIPQEALALRRNVPGGRDPAAGEIQTVEPDRSGPVPSDRSRKTDNGPGSARAKHDDASAPMPARSLEPIPSHDGPQYAAGLPKQAPSSKKPEERIVVLVWVTRSPSG